MEKYRNNAAVRLALQHYLKQMRTNWYLVLPAMILPSIGTVLVFYTPPLLIGKMVTAYGNGAQTSEIWKYIYAIAAVWFVGELIWRFAIHFMIVSVANGAKQLYINALDLLLAKDISFFNDHFAGSLTKKVSGYSRNFEAFSDTLSFNVASQFLPLIFISIILWGYSPWLVLTLITGLISTIMILLPFIKKRQAMVAAREAASNVVAGNVADTLSNIHAVRSFAREKYEAKRHRNNVADLVNKSVISWHYHNRVIDMITSPMYVLTNLAGLIVAISVGRGTGASVETVFVSFTFFAGFTRVFWEFNRIYRNIETAITDAAQFTELLLDEPVIKDPLIPQKFKLQSGETEFKKVRFKYQDSTGKHLFNNFDLKIKSGEKIGLVGHSGGGKTTITRLLMRFMDVDEGEILIDGQNIKNVSQADFRKYIAYVPQEPALFHRSLADNIRYGLLDASDNNVKKAAKMANASDFIEGLANGYETLVGERGVKLSGGQRQRVAIARAMLKNAPILVLDEATSALDSESEKLIQDALWKLMEGRTAIVIAHRLSTIQKMDRIVVLEDGKIVEEGTHKELLNKKGVYAGLWAHQSGGFLEE